MPIKKISDPIYCVDIYFIFDLPKEKVFPFLKKKWDCDFSHHWDKAGFTFGNEDNEWFICFPYSPKTWDYTTILAHECLHIASRVLRGKGIVLSDESEEAFTYYHGWMMQSLTDIYKEHYKAKRKKS
jgi:hypothetical protein